MTDMSEQMFCTSKEWTWRLAMMVAS
jgi:hypothetical protein